MVSDQRFECGCVLRRVCHHKVLLHPMWFIFGFDLEREVMGVEMNIYRELSMI
jgi:hypothetical protein